MPNRPRVLGAMLLLAALAGCAAPPPEPSGPRIASMALFDPGRFADVWHVVATTEPVCGKLAETWVPVAPDRFRVTGTACGPQGPRAFLTEAQVSGPGRITRRNGPRVEELWVLWVDADYRIAVIGTPDRSFARILARQPSVRADLMAAAREVLDFNGYDPGTLHPL